MHCKHARRQIESISHPARSAPELMQHLSRCGPCRKLFAQATVLHDAIAQLRSDNSDIGPSQSVEQHVLAALNAPIPTQHTAGNTWRWFTASACLALTVFLLALWITPRQPPAVQPAQSPQSGSEAFTPMPYVIPPAPYERTAIIRTVVPLPILLSAGFQIHGEDPASSTPADVLLGEDGRILALRLVAQPTSFSNTRMD